MDEAYCKGERDETDFSPFVLYISADRRDTVSHEKRNRRLAEEASGGKNGIEVSASDILSGGSAHGHPYIVYRAPSGKVMVATDFKRNGKTCLCHPDYCNYLCESVEVFRTLTREAVQETAYSTWMCAAR